MYWVFIIIFTWCWAPKFLKIKEIFKNSSDILSRKYILEEREEWLFNNLLHKKGWEKRKALYELLKFILFSIIFLLWSSSIYVILEFIYFFIGNKKAFIIFLEWAFFIPFYWKYLLFVIMIWISSWFIIYFIIYFRILTINNEKIKKWGGRFDKEDEEKIKNNFIREKYISFNSAPKEWIEELFPDLKNKKKKAIRKKISLEDLIFKYYEYSLENLDLKLEDIPKRNDGEMLQIFDYIFFKRMYIKYGEGLFKELK